MLNPLPTEVVQRLRSGVAITSVSHCVDELVINAIDAGATCIAVRLNLPFYKIQVIDNGNGIDKVQMESIGVRYATSKCRSLSDLHNLKSGGFRGEALAGLKDMSSVLMIESRSQHSEDTFCKIFMHGRPPQIQKSCVDRPSKGTTVTVHNFMYNMPVRKQCISEVLDLEDCRKSLEKLAIIYPQISFSLRCDTTGEICLETRKCNSIKSAFRYLFGHEKTQNLREISIKKEPYDISGFVSTDGHITKDLQLMYVNKRFVHRSKLQKLVSAILKKFLFSRQKAANVKDRSTLSLPSHSPSKSQIRYAIFIINITCPYDEYDIMLEPRKTLVEFTDWEKVLKIVEEVIFKFLKDNGHWADKESTIELSTEKSAVPFPDDASNSLHNFPSDLGKTISAQDNRKGLFSIPAKRVISNHFEHASITPSKKLLFSNDSSDPSLQKLRPSKFENKAENLEKHTSLNVTSNDLPNDSKETKNSKSAKFNFQPQASSLSFLNIPGTGVCLKEISKILGRQSEGKSEISKERFLKGKLIEPTEPLTVLGKFEFNAPKESSKFEVLKRNEATQTKNHVTINPLVKEFHRSKNISKYTFTDDLNLKPLKGLKPRKGNHSKSRLFHKDVQQKQTQIHIPDKSSSPSHQSIFQNEKTSVDHPIKTQMSTNDRLAQKMINDKLHDHRKLVDTCTSKTSASQKAGLRYSTCKDLKLCKRDRLHYVPHMQGIGQVLHENSKYRNQRVPTVINKSSGRINDTKSLLKNYEKFRSLKRMFKLHHGTLVCQTKYDSDLCHKSFLTSKMPKVRKQSPKSYLSNPFFPDKDHRNHITSSPTSFFSKHNIDVMRAKGRAILNSSPVECEFSRHGNIIGLKTPAKSFDFTSEVCTFDSPHYFSEEHLEYESEFDLQPSHVICDTFSNHKNQSISKSSKNGSSIYDDTLQQSSRNSHSIFPFVRNLNDIDVSHDAESLDGMEISHEIGPPEVQNDSTMSKEKLGIWKEVPDSPPSPNQDDRKSPEPNLSLACRLPFASHSFTDSVRLPANGDECFNGSYVASSNHNMFSANYEGYNVQNVGNNERNTHHEGHNVQNESDNAQNRDICDTTVNPNLSTKIGNISIVPAGDVLNRSRKNETRFLKPFAISPCNTLNLQLNELPTAVISDILTTDENLQHKEHETSHTNNRCFIKPDTAIQNVDIIAKESNDLTSIPFMPAPESTDTNLQETLHMDNPSVFVDPLLPKPLTEGEVVPQYVKDVLTSNSVIECKLQNHIEKQESSDLFIKWKDHQRDFPGNGIEDLFSSWENPMFQRSSTEVESVNSAAATQSLATMYEILNSYRFSKKAFTHLQVVGQVDQKFIACLVTDVNEDFKGKRLLVLFDQHAVHERIRLEELISDFYETDESGSKKALSAPLVPPLEVELNQNESRLIHSVPGCLLERANNELKRNRMPTVSSLVESIIREWIILLEQTRNPVTVLPKTLAGILNSQACHGAVKFGDPLDKIQCVNLLGTLSVCNLPFQCAHGRPSLAPLLDLEKIDICKKKSPPQLKKLSRLMRESRACLGK